MDISASCDIESVCTQAQVGSQDAVLINMLAQHNHEDCLFACSDKLCAAKCPILPVPY